MKDISQESLHMNLQNPNSNHKQDKKEGRTTTIKSKKKKIEENEME